MADLHVLVDILVVLVAAKLAAEVSERIGMPAVVGEIAAGVLVGPSVLGAVEPTEVLRVLGEMGVILLLLDVGLEMDLGELRAVGRSSLAVAVVGIVAPFAGGLGVGAVAGWESTEVIFVAAALTATSVGISARVFGDLRALGTPEARTVLGAAVIDDVLGLVILTVVVRLADAGGVSVGEVATVVLAALAFLVAALTVGVKVVPPVFDLVTRLSRSTGTLVALGFAFALGVAELASIAKLAPIVGAFVAGLALAPSRAADRVRRELSPVGHLLIPVFFLQIGIDADIGRFADVEVLGIAALLCVVGVVGKVIGGRAAAASSGDRWLIGLGMIPRGEVGLIFATIGLRQGVFGEDVYAALLLVVLFTTLVTPPILRLRLLRRVPDVVQPGSVEPPPGGWLLIDDAAVELAAAPRPADVAEVALEAARQAATHEPGPQLLAWLASLPGDVVRWTPDATRAFRQLLRDDELRTWRVLHGTGALDALIPPLGAALRARHEEFSLDPWAALRFDRTAVLRERELDRGDGDPVPIAVLALDVADGDDGAALLAEQICRTVGQPELAERAGRLARDESLLRHRIGRPEVLSERSVTALAAYVGSAEAIGDLVRLTATDGSLDTVDHQRLAELGALVAAVAARDEAAGGTAQQRRLRARDLVDGHSASVAVLDGAPPAWLLAHEPADLAWLATRVADGPSPNGDVRVHVRARREGFDVTVIARDRIGLLARAARAITDSGLDVVSASVGSWPSRVAVSTFRVRGFDRPSPAAIASMLRVQLTQPLASPPAPEISLEFHTYGSPWHTTCRAVGPDRSGALWIIATAFASCEIDVHSARISTVDHRLGDVFELTRPGGAKLRAQDQEAALAALREGVSGLPLRRRPLLARRA